MATPLPSFVPPNSKALSLSISISLVPSVKKAAMYPPGNQAAAAPKSPVPWSTGLCGCFDDCGNCCITCWCPCITFGRIAEIVDRGSTSCRTAGALYALIAILTGCACCYSCCYRKKLREQFSLKAGPCPDCLVHCCCEHLSLCQEYRELQSRGFDMSIGYQANMERQQLQQGGYGGAAMPPAMQGGMTR